MTGQTQARPSARWHVPAAVAAWLLPGLGHMILGERRRGTILAVSIWSLWLLGVLIGGLSTLDRQQHKAWYLAQMFMAASVASDFGVQQVKAVVAQDHSPGVQHLWEEDYTAVPLPNDDPPAYEPSYGRINELGVLFTAVAGLLNLLAIIDVCYREPEHRSRRAGP